MACKKAKGPANGKSVQQNNNLDSTVHISAYVNGVSWVTDSAFGYSVKYSGNDSGFTNLMITATNYANNPITSMNFAITNFNGAGDYPINPPINTITYYVGTRRHFATTGMISVSAGTLYALRGTFSFTADTIDVTSGVFDVARP